MLVVALGACRSTPPLLTTDADAPPRAFSVAIPEGYTVLSASFGLATDTSVSGGMFGNPVTSSSSESGIVSVLAATPEGERVLLVYRLGDERAAPALEVRLAEE